MTTLTAAEIANAMMAQNDQIASLIRDAEDADGLEHAQRFIEFVADLWIALGYGYKLAEARGRLEARAKALADGERNYLAGLRKNDKTRWSSEGNLKRLESLIFGVS